MKKLTKQLDKYKNLFILYLYRLKINRIKKIHIKFQKKKLLQQEKYIYSFLKLFFKKNCFIDSGKDYFPI